MFKIIKINYTKGELRQIRLFDLPLLQYELNEKKQPINISFPLLRKPDKNKPLVYLKFNSSNYAYSLWCMHHWINIVIALGYDFYIICDKKELEYKILEMIPFECSNIKFLKSDRKTMKKNILNICEPTWQKAGFAHITTFIHAVRNGIKEFWNIDADDTSFFEVPEQIIKGLKTAEDYARENNIDLFSYDMHRTRFHGKHWSFGITFTRMSDKIIENIKSITDDSWINNLEHKIGAKITCKNLDWFFTYLLEFQKIKISSFTIDNLYFIHWGVANTTGLSELIKITGNGFVRLPMLNVIASEEKNDTFPIYNDVISIDAGIREKNSRSFLEQILNGYRKKINNLYC